MLRPARPPLMWSRVVIILAVTAGFCSSGWTVAQIFTFLVASAMPAIMVTDSSEWPQWLVSPPKPRHLPMDMTKSMPTSSAVIAAARFWVHRSSSGGEVLEMIQPPLATGRKTPNSLLGEGF